MTAPKLVVVLAPTGEDHRDDTIVVGPEAIDRLWDLQRKYKHVEVWIDQ